MLLTEKLLHIFLTNKIFNLSKEFNLKGHKYFYFIILQMDMNKIINFTLNMLSIQEIAVKDCYNLLTMYQIML